MATTEAAPTLAELRDRIERLEQLVAGRTPAAPRFVLLGDVDPQRFYKVREVAALVGVSVQAVYKAIDLKQLAVRGDGVMRVFGADLLAFVDARNRTGRRIPKPGTSRTR